MARRRRLETLTGWSMMWIICMFDIPVRTRTEMRKATRFRNLLLDNGFVMKQFSVYIKPVKSLSVGQTTTKSFQNLFLIIHQCHLSTSQINNI